jgi:hypothetical protein
MRAEELSRAAEDLFVQAQEALANAKAAAGREVDDAKARATAEGEELLERARTDAREVARRAAEEEQVRREHLQALEEHRQRIMEEIGVLHQRLGSIGDGLSAPVRPQQAKHRARQGELEAPAAAVPAQNERREQSDDDTMILELPAGAKPTRRKVASSGR